MWKSSQHNERPIQYDSTQGEYCTKLIVGVPQQFDMIIDLLTSNVSKIASESLQYPGSLEKHPTLSQLLPKRAPLRSQPSFDIPENTKDTACILNDFGHCTIKNFVDYMLWKENELCIIDMTPDLRF